VTPPLAPGDVLASVRKELERNGVRARNAIRYVTGTEWAPPAPTPSETIWREGKAELRRYLGPVPRRETPVLAFVGLVSRAYVFDLVAGNSFVRRLMDAGFDTYILDWGVPDETEAHNTVETYVQGQLPRAIRALLREAGADEVSLIGYCMGGDLALLALTAQPDLPVRNLVAMATPVDFRHMGPIADALIDGRLAPEDFLDETGNVPPALVGRFFRMRRPTADLVQYANLWENLWNDDYVEGHQAMGRYLREQLPLPGAAFLQITDQWLRGNAFIRGTLRLGGRRVSLADIRTPVLSVLCERDDIVPEPAAAPLADLLTGTETEQLRLDAGHSSLVVGRTAARMTLPRIVEWLIRQSANGAARAEETTA
jgi:polyhydroxyalkanoate synthase subunit PhaC